MKKLLLIGFLISYSFAVKDYIIKPNYNNSLYKVTKINSLYPEDLNSTIKNDSKNMFFYKGHFRVIFGKDYNNSEIIRNLANTLLDVANYVWKKEVVEFGFRPPRNSDKYYIDIYIGNTRAYNPEIGYVTIENDYCGYAIAYNNGTPYFVINPGMSIDLIKVTIAHEFFHTIQYAYGVDETTYSIWRDNIWFLEATATLMEDEVYDDVNDYLNYLKSFFSHPNYPIDYVNGIIEYGKVIFAKYIREKYGLEKIKKIFEDYETNETILDDLKKEFDFDNLMLGFAKCVVNKDTCFEEGSSYPNLTYFSLDSTNNIYYYGIGFINIGIDNYLISSNKEYLQEDFNGSLNKISNINQTGLIVINRQEDILSTNFLSNNKYNLELKKGWNLIANIFNDNLDLSTLEGIIFWVYRDGKYEAYSNISELATAINDKNFRMNNNFIYKNEGFWVYSDKDINLTIFKDTLADNNVTLKDGWQIVGFSSAFEPKYINAKIIWGYDNNWSYYGDVDLNISKLEDIKPSKGYFIFK